MLDLEQAQPIPVYDITADMITRKLYVTQSLTGLINDIQKIIAEYSQHQYQKIWRAYSHGTFEPDIDSWQSRDYKDKYNKLDLWHDSNSERDIVYASLCYTTAIRSSGDSWIHEWKSVDDIINSIKDRYNFVSVIEYGAGAITDLFSHLNELKKQDLADDNICYQQD